jgi:acyl-CoA reductase-like NAD-dependent aldehyde dehydrogenase
LRTQRKTLLPFFLSKAEKCARVIFHFGPVISAIPFTDIEEVIKRGNATHFGLGSGVWTRDLSKAHRLAKGLRVGLVWVKLLSGVRPGRPVRRL